MKGTLTMRLSALKPLISTWKSEKINPCSPEAQSHETESGEEQKRMQWKLDSSIPLAPEENQAIDWTHHSRKRLTIIPPTYIGFYEEKSHIYSLSPLIRMSLKSNHKREVRRYRLRSEHCFRQENPSLTYALRQTKPSGQVQYNGCCLPLRLCQHRGFHSTRRRKPFYETIKTNSKEPVFNKDLVFQAGSSSYAPSHSIYFDLCRSYSQSFGEGTKASLTVTPTSAS